MTNITYFKSSLERERIFFIFQVLIFILLTMTADRKENNQYTAFTYLENLYAAPPEICLRCCGSNKTEPFKHSCSKQANPFCILLQVRSYFLKRNSPGWICPMWGEMVEIPHGDRKKCSLWGQVDRSKTQQYIYIRFKSIENIYILKPVLQSLSIKK